MTGLSYSLQLTSTLSILLPIIAGTWVIKRADFKIRLFYAFLITGLITDLMGWYFYSIRDGDANTVLRYFYSLTEALFLLWLIGALSANKIINVLFTRSWLIFFPFWILSVTLLKNIALFETTSAVMIAFGSSFYLVQLIEKEDQVSKLFSFWLILGIFFYSFCTFFFMSLVTTELGLNLWFMHNCVNIITNAIYFYGFCTQLRRRQSRQSSL